MFLSVYTIERMREETVCQAYYWISVFQPLTLLRIILVFCLRVTA